jgi:hypothetical protein
MKKYLIRFNKSRGTDGRGTKDHAWRVFEDDQEYLFKNFELQVPSFSEKDDNNEDWNLCCFGRLEIDKETSTAIIKSTQETLTNYDATQVCKI